MTSSTPATRRRTPASARSECACSCRSPCAAPNASSLPSQSTRSDLVELLGVPAERIDVVPEGLGAAVVARKQDADTTDHEQARERARNAFAIGERRVVLSLSAKRPHKNLAGLIRALARIPDERRPVLVLPGYPTWHEPELRALADALGVADHVRFLGWLPAEQIEALWALADVFAYPIAV